MQIDAEMRRKIVVSVAATVLFTAAMLYVGFTYGQGGLSDAGGQALVAVIVGFVVVMGGVGLYLSRYS